MSGNKKVPVGIDLGTTFSAIAYVNEDTQRAEIIVTPDQERIVNSVVMFEGENNVIVGDLARKNAVAEPTRVAEFVKRQMGKPKEDILDKGNVVNEGWHFEVDGKKYSAQEISALILKRLKTAAEERLGVEITDAVITCPAYFGDPERAATKEAGRIAGFNVLAILDEPIAAALSYRLDKVKKDEKVFVFDLGGGTFDVTIIDIAGGNIREIAVGGNHNLGGKDWDDNVIKHIANMFKEQYNVNPLEDLAAYQELQLKATEAKIALSRKDKTTIVFSYAGNSLKHELTRQQFEELTKDLLQECEMLCDKVLGEVKMTWNGIDTLLLVGGSTKMPMVDEMLKRISGKIPSKDLNPDECVALGAAWQAVLKKTDPVSDELKGKIGGINVQKVSSHDLGVIALNSQGQERSFLMIPKFTPLPSTDRSQH
jgi:molecular chaperone DnaK